MVYTFTQTTGWVAYQHIKQDVLLRIGRIVAAHGAQTPPPAQPLHMAPQAADQQEMQALAPS